MSKKLIATAAVITALLFTLLSCNNSAENPRVSCDQDLPEEGQHKYIVIGTNRDGKKSEQYSIISINISSRYDSVAGKRVLSIDTIPALLRQVTVKKDDGKDTTGMAWIATTMDSVKLVNPLPIDSLLKQ